MKKNYFITLCIAFMLVACGKKGDLLPPNHQDSLPIKAQLAAPE